MIDLQLIVDHTTTYFDLYIYIKQHTPPSLFNQTMREARTLFVNKQPSEPMPVTIFNKE